MRLLATSINYNIKTAHAEARVDSVALHKICSLIGSPAIAEIGLIREFEKCLDSDLRGMCISARCPGRRKSSLDSHAQQLSLSCLSFMDLMRSVPCIRALWNDTRSCLPSIKVCKVRTSQWALLIVPRTQLAVHDVSTLSPVLLSTYNGLSGLSSCNFTSFHAIGTCAMKDQKIQVRITEEAWLQKREVPESKNGRFCSSHCLSKAPGLS